MITTMIPIDRLRPFDGHPFQVQDDAEMATLTDSIQSQGVLSPLIVRPIENSADEYEIVSGHRRFHAAQKAGLSEVPAIIYALDHDETAIALVDSNLHREHLLPSEKAFAYRLKLEALNHQGKATSRQVVGKFESADFVSETESGRQVQRYIRLTCLIPPLLQLVDERRIAFTPAVELSYLTEQEQRWLYDELQRSDCTPSLSQAQRLRGLSAQGYCDPEAIGEIMSEEKANQKERVRIPTERIRKYFPQDFTTAQMEEAIIKLCEASYRKRHQSRDAR